MVSNKKKRQRRKKCKREEQAYHRYQIEQGIKIKRADTMNFEGNKLSVNALAQALMETRLSGKQ